MGEGTGIYRVGSQGRLARATGALTPMHNVSVDWPVTWLLAGFRTFKISYVIQTVNGGNSLDPISKDQQTQLLGELTSLISSIELAGLPP